MARKVYGLHARDHLPGGADPIPLSDGTTPYAEALGTLSVSGTPWSYNDYLDLEVLTTNDSDVFEFNSSPAGILVKQTGIYQMMAIGSWSFTGFTAADLPDYSTLTLTSDSYGMAAYHGSGLWTIGQPLDQDHYQPPCWTMTIRVPVTTRVFRPFLWTSGGSDDWDMEFYATFARLGDIGDSWVSTP